MTKKGGVLGPADFTSELAQELITQYGNPTSAARAIQTRCLDRYGRMPSVNAIYLWITRAKDYGSVAGTRSGKTIMASEEAESQKQKLERAHQLINVLDEAGIGVEEVGEIRSVKLKSGFHEVVTKDPDGKPVVTRARTKTTGLMFHPNWEKGPDWPVVQPAKPVTIKISPVKKPERAGKCIVVLSDVQVGFLRDIEDVSHLVPMHDNQAIDVALQIVNYLQPNQLCYVGDFLDLAEMSRYIQLEEFWRTTQPAIDEGYKILAQFEAAAGPDREPTQFIGGNHDRRLREYVTKNARAAFHLRPARSTPEDWPDLSIGRLLRFEELGIHYCGEYPGGEWWITPDLVVRHNPEVRGAYAASVIAGHTHHVKRTTYSHRGQFGPEHQTLYEIGCLCSLDKYGDKTSLGSTKVPSNRGFVKDWTHGFAVVYVTEDGRHTVEQVEYIEPGRAIFHGKEFLASAEPV